MLDWFKSNLQTSLFETLNGSLPNLNNKSLILILDSSVEKDFVEKNLLQIKGFLKRHFTDFEDIRLEITKNTKSKKILLNQKDKFLKLAKKNPMLEKMRKDLRLELEM